MPNYKCLCAVCNFMLNILVIWNRNNFQGRNMICSKWKGLINGNNTSQGSNTEVIEVSQGNQTVVSRWKWRFIGHYSITVITKTLSKIKSVPFLAAANPLLMLIWNLIFRIHCKTIQIKYPINSTKTKYQKMSIYVILDILYFSENLFLLNNYCTLYMQVITHNIENNMAKAAIWHLSNSNIIYNDHNVHLTKEVF